MFKRIADDIEFSLNLIFIKIYNFVSRYKFSIFSTEYKSSWSNSTSCSIAWGLIVSSLNNTSKSRLDLSIFISFSNLPCLFYWDNHNCFFLEEVQPVAHKNMLNKNIKKRLNSFFINFRYKINYFHNKLLQHFDKR